MPCRNNGISLNIEQLFGDVKAVTVANLRAPNRARCNLISHAARFPSPQLLT